MTRWVTEVVSDCVRCTGLRDNERMIVCVSIADSKVRDDERMIVCVSIADSKVRTMNGWLYVSVLQTARCVAIRLNIVELEGEGEGVDGDTSHTETQRSA